MSGLQFYCTFYLLVMLPYLIFVSNFFFFFFFCICSFVGNRGLCGKQINVACKNGGTGGIPGTFRSGNFECTEHSFVGVW